MKPNDGLKTSTLGTGGNHDVKLGSRSFSSTSFQATCDVHVMGCSSTMAQHHGAVSVSESFVRRVPKSLGSSEKNKVGQLTVWLCVHDHDLDMPSN